MQRTVLGDEHLGGEETKYHFPHEFWFSKLCYTVFLPIFE